MLSSNGYVQSQNLPAARPSAAPRWNYRTAADNGVRNELLAGLPSGSLRFLLKRMESVPLNRRQIVQERNLPLRHAYFIEGGAASLLARAGDRSTIEIRTLGRKDFVGIPLVLGTGRSPHRCVVQVAGSAMRIAANDLVSAMNECPELRRILLAYVQAALAHSAQLVACNTRHSLSERLARWLLVANNRLDSDEIPMTHHCVSRALGVRRASITTAMGRMEEAGLIRRGRGWILIIDNAGLEQVCCGCHAVISAEHQKVLLQLSELGLRRRVS
jgi:CRP-like cAMP-binding protein